MAEYIERQKLLDSIFHRLGIKKSERWLLPAEMVLYDEVKKAPAADVVEVVRCKECKFWKDIHVLQNDGRERQYTQEESAEFLFSFPCVSNNVGINVGSTCMYYGCVYEKTVFRNADDYCSKGEKRPCSYEQWWGIVDGYYPTQE